MSKALTLLALVHSIHEEDGVGPLSLAPGMKVKYMMDGKECVGEICANADGLIYDEASDSYCVSADGAMVMVPSKELTIAGDAPAAPAAEPPPGGAAPESTTTTTVVQKTPEQLKIENDEKAKALAEAKRKMAAAMGAKSNEGKRIFGLDGRLIKEDGGAEELPANPNPDGGASGGPGDVLPKMQEMCMAMKEALLPMKGMIVSHAPKTHAHLEAIEQSLDQAHKMYEEEMGLPGTGEPSATNPAGQDQGTQLDTK